jgi:hypothetical protein
MTRHGVHTGQVVVISLYCLFRVVPVLSVPDFFQFQVREVYDITYNLYEVHDHGS